jgi:hypothetical protein
VERGGGLAMAMIVAVGSGWFSHRWPVVVVLVVGLVVGGLCNRCNRDVTVASL